MASPEVIPLTATAFQSLKLTLSGKVVQLDIQQRSTGLYMDVWLSAKRILAGVICLNRTWLVRDAYFGMPGDLVFIDQQGSSDPEYSGLGSRYLLMYEEGKNV